MEESTGFCPNKGIFG